MPSRLRIAIDGPSGVGKTTVAGAVAARLGYAYVETGAMYRGVALLALESGTGLEDGSGLGKLAQTAEMKFQETQVGSVFLLNGRDVTGAIRSPEVTLAASRVAVHPEVRRWMVQRQREMAAGGGVVMEGRDIGTVVLPDAEVKVFLDASPEVRTERRLRDAGDPAGTSPHALHEALSERDERDRSRAVSPLKAASDAVHIDTSLFTAEQVIQQVLDLVYSRQAAPSASRTGPDNQA